MNLTEEQRKIVESKGNIRVNAVAGSGKTSTIIEYAAAQPPDSKILYLAFNRTVRLEAEEKFRERGLTNVRVQTAHSLAYGFIVPARNFKVQVNDYKAQDLIEILKLKDDYVHSKAALLATHVGKCFAWYCNSIVENVSELNYLEVLSGSRALHFAKGNLEIIKGLTEKLVELMRSGAIEVTHDFYLKEFQISKPILPFDCILFDEGQDASPAMLDIFLNQEATKVIVGDTHQQIYSWRFAVNSLEKADFPIFHLSTSFRFNQNIADLAKQVLDLKGLLGVVPDAQINGVGRAGEVRSRAILARTNLQLLVKAIEYVVGQGNTNKIYFEGNISSYTYAQSGGSLYDVLNLKMGKRSIIRNSVIREMKDLIELEDYARQTEDVDLLTMIEVVKKYGAAIPDILKKLKSLHLPDDQKHQARVIFSTVHRSKGMEYDGVILAEDFIDKEKIQRILASEDEDATSRLIEEINLLYVAVTRAKYKLNLPVNLLPPLYEAIDNVTTSKPKPSVERKQTITTIRRSRTPAQKLPPNTEKQWSRDQDETVQRMLKQGKTVKSIARTLGRSTWAIEKRINELKGSVQSQL